MSLALTLAIYLVVALSWAWVFSFAPRFVAAERGVGALDLVRAPADMARRLVAKPRPFLSFSFWRYMMKGGRLLEFVIAVLVASSLARAASAFLKTAAAVP